MEELFRIVAIGGDFLVYLVLYGMYLLWKFDRRLFKIELLFSNHLKHLKKEEEEEGR